jgi:hypothetical protein
LIKSAGGNAARLGFEVTATFNDRAITGSNNKRPGYRQILAEARRGSFDVVIVEAVDPDAAIVEQIFSMFASGVSPRVIARRLNVEGVLGPEGRLWQDTTILGQ